MRRLPSVLLVAAATMFAGCDDATGPAATPTVHAAAVPSSNPRAGWVTLVVTIANETARSIRVSGDAPALLEIRDAAGRLVAGPGVWTGPVLGISRGPRTLAPGETVVVQAAWNGTRKDGTPAAPGAYRVRPATLVYGDRRAALVYGPLVAVSLDAR